MTAPAKVWVLSVAYEGHLGIYATREAAEREKARMLAEAAASARRRWANYEWPGRTLEEYISEEVEDVERGIDIEETDVQT